MIFTDGSEISLAQTLDLCEGCISLSNVKAHITCRKSRLVSDESIPLFRLVREKARENT